MNVKKLYISLALTLSLLALAGVLALLRTPLTVVGSSAASPSATTSTGLRAGPAAGSEQGAGSAWATQNGGAWQRVNTPNSPGNRTGHSLVTIDNDVYLFGGAVEGGDGLPWQDNIYVFGGEVPGLGWVEISAPAPRPPARAHHSAAVVDGKMVIHGGAAGGDPLGDTWVYDPQANTWTQKSSSGPARTHHSAVVSNGKMYLVGGADSGGLPSAEVWGYDLTSSSWTQGADYPGPPGGACGTAVFAPDSTIMVGGTTGNDYYVYDPNTDTWTPKTAASGFPDRVSPGTAQMGDTGYIFGGEDYATSKFRTDVWKADLTQDPVQWEPEPPEMPNHEAPAILIPEMYSPVVPLENYDLLVVPEPAVLLYGRSWTYDPGNPFPIPIFGDAATFLFWPNRPAAGALAGVTVSPDAVTLAEGEQQLFTADGQDASGYYVPVTPTWSATGGYVTDYGLYTAGNLPGRYSVRAAVDAMLGNATVEVSGTAACPDLTPTESWTHTFPVAGTYPYYDGYAPDHTGAVVVTPALRAAPDIPNTTWDVSITATGLDPPTITIGLNDTVRWINTDSSVHTVNGGVYYYSPCAGLDDVIIAGPPTATVGLAATFTATVVPTDATLPVTYTWRASESANQRVVTHTGGLSDTLVFTWNVTGPQTVTVTAVNECGTVVSRTHAITVEAGMRYIYLPLVVRNFAVGERVWSRQ